MLTVYEKTLMDNLRTLAENELRNLAEINGRLAHIANIAEDLGIDAASVTKMRLCGEQSFKLFRTSCLDELQGLLNTCNASGALVELSRGKKHSGNTFVGCESDNDETLLKLKNANTHKLMVGKNNKTKPPVMESDSDSDSDWNPDEDAIKSDEECIENDSDTEVGTINLSYQDVMASLKNHLSRGQITDPRIIDLDLECNQHLEDESDDSQDEDYSDIDIEESEESGEDEWDEDEDEEDFSMDEEDFSEDEEDFSEDEEEEEEGGEEEGEDEEDEEDEEEEEEEEGEDGEEEGNRDEEEDGDGEEEEDGEEDGNRDEEEDGNRDGGSEGVKSESKNESTSAVEEVRTDGITANSRSDSKTTKSTVDAGLGKDVVKQEGSQSKSEQVVEINSGKGKQCLPNVEMNIQKSTTDSSKKKKKAQEKSSEDGIDRKGSNKPKKKKLPESIIERKLRNSRRRRREEELLELELSGGANTEELGKQQILSTMIGLLAKDHKI